MTRLRLTAALVLWFYAASALAQTGAETKPATPPPPPAAPQAAPAPPSPPPPPPPPSEPSVKASPETGPKLPPVKESETPPPPSAGGQLPERVPGPGLTGESKSLAPPAEETAPQAAMDEKISLDLRDIDVLDVLKFLAIKANLNIIAGKGVTGNVSLLLNDVSIRDAIDIILSVSRLAYTIKGNIMRVTTEEEYKALYGKEFYDKRQTKIVRLQYASAKNVGAMLENHKSAVGRIVYDDSTGTIVMTDTAEKIEEMEEIIRHEELPSIVRVPPTVSEIFDIEYADAAKLSEKIAPALTKDIGKVYVDDRGRRLIVSDLPYKIPEIKELVRAFDTKTREVFIEAKIVQISLNDKFQAGVDWASVANGHFQQSFPINLSSFGRMAIGTIAPQTTTNADGTTSATFSGSGIILKALESFGKVSILSTPQIAATDGEEAKIMVGTKEAYTTSSVTQSQATTTTAQQVTFIDVGVNLKVTPVISSNGFITMKIKPEVSSVTRFLTTAQGDQIPIVESTNAETKVMVKDGTTVLVGGLMATTRRKTRSGVPILSRIPILGLAFRSTDDAAVNTELSVLLTPHIITGDETLPGTTRPPSVAQVDIPPAGAAGDGAKTASGTPAAAAPAPAPAPASPPSTESTTEPKKKVKKWRTKTY